LLFGQFNDTWTFSGEQDISAIARGSSFLRSFLSFTRRPSHHPQKMLALFALVSLLGHTATALRVTPESPCLSSCGGTVKNTTGDDIVCRDGQFMDDETGLRFKQCVECELESDHFISRTGESDVEWGLCKSNLNLPLSQF
jgi:hypothetical protein